jgi:hypothetical protein
MRRDDGWVFNPDNIEPGLRDFNRESLRRILMLDVELRRLLLAAHAQVKRDAKA